MIRSFSVSSFTRKVIRPCPSSPKMARRMARLLAWTGEASQGASRRCRRTLDEVFVADLGGESVEFVQGASVEAVKGEGHKRSSQVGGT